MRINFSKACAGALLLGLPFVSLSAADADANAQKLARLEARLVELEARLAETEQETKEVKVLASNSGAGGNNASVLGNAGTFDILANSAWRNLRWTQEEQWEGIRNGMSEDEVVELLGSPPRSVKSVKPRIDEVFYYETSIRDRANALKGRISFRKGTVVAFEKPNFKSLKQSN